MAAQGVLYLAIATHNLSGTDLAQNYCKAESDSPHAGLNQVIDLLSRIAAGNEQARVYVAADDAAGTAATGTVACTQANATVGETCVVCGVTFTIKAAASSNPRDGYVVAGASDTTFGDALAACINAHPLLQDMCSAANAAGTVTVTFKDKGLFGNLALFAETGDAFAVTSPTNGAEGTLTMPMKVWARGI